MYFDNVVIDNLLTFKEERNYKNTSNKVIRYLCI